MLQRVAPVLNQFLPCPRFPAALVAGVLGFGSALAVPAAAEEFSWQRPYAAVQPTGGIEWSPEAYRYVAGEEVRYIDFDAGDDLADGRSPGAAWKHHPWDKQFAGRVGAAEGVDTFVFKRGVMYRGALAVPASGEDEQAVQLMSDPAWGGEENEAVITGSQRVEGWQRLDAHPEVPEPQKVWFADLDFSPRNLWMVDDAGAFVRLPLARTPNWRVENRDDIKSQWWHFNNPDAPRERVTIDGQELLLGTDTVHLTLPAEAVEGAYVWTEYGWVMGTPYPSRVAAYYPERHAIAIEGQWGRGAGVLQLPRFSRYFLEDKPQFLDDPAGEFWFDKTGSGPQGGGRLYVRLPEGLFPGTTPIEAARHSTLVDATEANDLRITRLTFARTNTHWNLHAPPSAGKEVEPAAIRVLGRGRNLEVANCRFTQVNKAVRVVPTGEGATIDGVVIRDNEIVQTDHSAIQLYDGSEWGQEYPTTRLFDVKVLRNRLTEIGHRPTRYDQGHAIDILCAETTEVAGNVLDQLYGAGIFVYGGKRSAAKTDRPFSRILIHHNQVTDSLLNNNDWGGIETWQGGPAYVYNNVSGNPGGFKLWGIKGEPNKPGSARFGHAYYMDGGFKQYYFNNIAWGKSSDPFGPLGNTAAFQEIHGYLASLFNNTAYNFVVGSRRQSPAAGQNKYLGNIWQSIGHLVFRHADPSGQQADPNIADTAAATSEYEHATNVYVANRFFDLGEQFAVFEPTGQWYGTIEAFRNALAKRGSLGDVGVVVERSLLIDPENHDFRPTADAEGGGVKAFVPWALSGVVAEWHFYHVGGDPATVADEHFHLAPYYVNREDYLIQPRYPLTVRGAGGERYEHGPLEDWAAGALRFEGGEGYAVVPAETLAGGPEEVVVPLTNRGAEWVRFEAPDEITPGERVTVELRLAGHVPAGQMLRADLHWGSSSGSGGGFNASGGDGHRIDGAGPYTFTFKTQNKNRLGKFTVAAYVSPDGSWENRTQTASFDIRKAVDRPEGGYRSPRIDRSNLLVELYAQLDPANGRAVLASNLVGGQGYELRLNEGGRLEFEVAGEGQAATLTSNAVVNDGSWRHMVVEADRQAQTLRCYIDGKHDSDASGVGAVSLVNEGPLYVGGSPGPGAFRGRLEFLRIAQGTLADAKTTIEELYAWQFDGPFLRDFAGRAPVGQRDAGALEGAGQAE